MSSVKAVNFQHPSSDAANITLGSDGSVVLPAGFSGGLGTNVVSTTKTDTFSASLATANYASVTGLTATITPTSATSKILVIAYVTGVMTTDNDYGGIRLTRGGTPIAIGDAAGSRARQSGANFGSGTPGNTVTVLTVDSPATTSAVTYGVDVFNGASITKTVVVNRTSGDSDNNRTARFASTIAAIEVAA